MHNWLTLTGISNLSHIFLGLWANAGIILQNISWCFFSHSSNSLIVSVSHFCFPSLMKIVLLSKSKFSCSLFLLVHAGLLFPAPLPCVWVTDYILAAYQFNWASSPLHISALKVVAYFLEIVVSTYKTASCHIPEEQWAKASLNKVTN